jgi:carbonic anhydrase
MTKWKGARCGFRLYSALHIAVCSRFADPSVDLLERLFTGNAYYASKQTMKNPDAFTILSQGRTPQILWLGCADSRILETTMCYCKSGDIFVHHKLANTIHSDDYNAASVVQYTVAHLTG